MKLISMVEFVLEQSKIAKWNEEKEICLTPSLFTQKIVKYANFLKQPLELGMFVPCDEDGNVWKEPDSSEWNMKNITIKAAYEKQILEFQQAKDRVLFEYVQRNKPEAYEWVISKCKTIEGLATSNYDTTLTKSEIKQLGL